MHLAMHTSWMQWVENTALAIAIRQSLWVYPGLEVVHITGIVLLVGPAFLFDLRLLGISGHLPVEALASYLLPWSRRGLGILENLGGSQHSYRG